MYVYENQREMHHLIVEIRESDASSLSNITQMMNNPNITIIVQILLLIVQTDIQYFKNLRKIGNIFIFARY